MLTSLTLVDHFNPLNKHFQSAVYWKQPQPSIKWRDIKLSQQESDSLQNVKESVVIFKHSKCINSHDSYPLSHFRQLHTSQLSQLSCGDHDFFSDWNISPIFHTCVHTENVLNLKKKYLKKFTGNRLNY